MGFCLGLLALDRHVAAGAAGGDLDDGEVQLAPGEVDLHDAHLRDIADADLLARALAADDAGALKVGMQLVADAGFDPVAAGSLADSKAFDLGSSVSGRVLTAPEMRQALQLKL